MARGDNAANAGDPAVPDVGANRRALEVLRYAAVRQLEIASAVLVRTASTGTKLRLSRDVWLLAQTADIIAARLPGLRATAGPMPPGNARYERFAEEVLCLQDPDAQLAALTKVAYTGFRDAVLRHRRRLHPHADELTRACLDEVVGKLDGLSTDADDATGEETSRRLALRDAAAAFAMSCSAGPDPGTPRCALEVIPERPGRDPALREVGEVDRTAPGKGGLAAGLHDMAFQVELCAAEVCAALIAHHPEAPWGLRYDLARQVRDEGRHFELLTARMRDFDTEIGDHPIRYEVWDKFRLGRTLAERILIEQRLGEGVGLDGGLRLYESLKEAGDEKTALILDYINADEVIHVGNGNRWLLRLLGSHEAIAGLEERLRRKLADNGVPVRYRKPINEEYRSLAGFSEAELTELRRAWAAEQQSGRE